MRSILIATATLILASCANNKKTPLVFLNKSQVFNTDSVRAFLESNIPAAQIDSSKKVFLSAIDLLKNKKDAAASAEMFIKSLSIYPNASAYYELGNAYLETKQWNDALKTFQMAEKMNYAPLGNVLFKEASCFAAMDSIDKMYAYVTYAVQNGFVDKDKIVNDVHFASYKSDPTLLSTYNEAMSGNGDPDEVLWQGYSRDFEQAKFPLTVDSGTLGRMGEPKIISYDYEKFVPEMRDNKFSRDVGSEFFYVAMLKQSELCHVVIYGCRSYEETGAPVYYILASFNSKGKLIDKMIIGGSKTYDEPTKEFTVQNNLQFEVKEYKNTYEKSTDENGYENNKVVSRSLVATHEYIIDQNGKFVTAQQS